jgi:hypothetical protein
VKVTLLCLVLAALQVPQEDLDGTALPPPLPPTPNPVESPTVEPQPDPQPPRRKRRKRRQATPAQPKVKVKQEPTSAAPPAAKKRRRVKKLPLERPEPWDFVTPYKPLDVTDRALVAAAQGGCALVGVAGTLAGMGSAALLARTLDRPAGGLLHPPMPVGGVLPVVVGTLASATTTAVCVVGLGALAERRIAGVGLALGGWALVAAPVMTVALATVAWPSRVTTRNRVIKEDTVAASMVALAVLGPALALVGYHAGSVAQEVVDTRRHQEAVRAAKLAREEDEAAPPRRVAPPVPEPAPAVEEPPVEPVPSQPVAPDLAPAASEPVPAASEPATPASEPTTPASEPATPAPASVAHEPPPGSAPAVLPEEPSPPPVLPPGGPQP